jgi:hypothetical protein
MIDVFKSALVLTLQISMQGMHVVQLLLKFESQLHLLLMSFNFLGEFFLEFLSEKLLFLLLLLKLILSLGKLIKSLL